MPKIPISLQMYTLRDDAQKDFLGTFRRVSEIGYAAVELAGHGGLSARDLKARLDDLHLKVSGAHAGLDALEGNIQQAIEDANTLGYTYVIVPYLAEDRRQGVDGYKKTAQTLNTLGETLRTFGLTLCYHNHDFEFRPLDNGQIGMDILLENTDPMLVKAEVDTYWVLHAGQDPVAFVKKYSGRVPLMHIKDRDPADGSFAEIGTGSLPLDALVAAASEIGTEYLVVEQDVCKRPPLESVAISYNNLKAKGYA